MFEKEMGNGLRPVLGKILAERYPAWQLTLPGNASRRQTSANSIAIFVGN